MGVSAGWIRRYERDGPTWTHVEGPLYRCKRHPEVGIFNVSGGGYWGGRDTYEGEPIDEGSCRGCVAECDAHQKHVNPDADFDVAVPGCQHCEDELEDDGSAVSSVE